MSSNTNTSTRKKQGSSRRAAKRQAEDRRFLPDNGLSIALFAAFGLSMVGMIVAGYHYQNEELATHGLPAISIGSYLMDESFLSALFENWESEWLQMAIYVVFTAYLFQRGSAESRDPDEAIGKKADDEKPVYPAAMSRSNLLRWLYRYSLGLTLSVLFVLSFVGHFLASNAASNADALAHGDETKSLLEYLGSSQLWLNPFRTGNRSSSRPECWWCCRSTFASRVRRNRKGLTPVMTKRGLEAVEVPAPIGARIGRHRGGQKKGPIEPALFLLHFDVGFARPNSQISENLDKCGDIFRAGKEDDAFVQFVQNPGLFK